MCTAVWFVDDDGNFYMGRNLDWGTGYGQKVVVTPRNWSWTSCHEGEIRTKSAIIGMGVLSNGTTGLPLYFDCANEDGLMVAGLSFVAGFAHYAKPVSGNTNVSSFELPLWLTSRFTTVAEVEDAATSLSPLPMISRHRNLHLLPSTGSWLTARVPSFLSRISLVCMCITMDSAF